MADNVAAQHDRQVQINFLVNEIRDLNVRIEFYNSREILLNDQLIERFACILKRADRKRMLLGLLDPNVPIPDHVREVLNWLQFFFAPNNESVSIIVRKFLIDV